MSRVPFFVVTAGYVGRWSEAEGGELRAADLDGLMNPLRETFWKIVESRQSAEVGAAPNYHVACAMAVPPCHR